jgi:hypothetical protein
LRLEVALPSGVRGPVDLTKISGWGGDAGLGKFFSGLRLGMGYRFAYECGGGADEAGRGSGSKPLISGWKEKFAIL